MKRINYSLIRTICALVIGLVLVLWSDVATRYIVITIGALFLIPGLISIIGFFASKLKWSASHRFPIEGVGSVLFGLWLVIMPDFFADVVIFLLGFILAMGGLQQIVSLSVARRWANVSASFYIVPILILIAGIVSLVDPTGARNTVLLIIGVSSIVYAVSELVNWFKFTRHRPVRTPSGANDIQDAELIE